MRTVKIAVAVAENGAVRTCGPEDYDETHYNSEMDAALTWLAEAGELVTATYWVEAELPDPIQHVRAPAVLNEEGKANE